MNWGTRMSFTHKAMNNRHIYLPENNKKSWSLLGIVKMHMATIKHS